MTSKRILSLVILTLVSFSSNAQLRIVCIGNSITQGKIGLKADNTYEYSYRPWLWEKLLKAGFKVDMVGFHPYFFDETKGNLVLNFETDGIPFDRDCEAYYGITSNAFLKGSESPGWTGEPLPAFTERINDPEKGYTPDIALIHIGTNDADSTEALVNFTRDNIFKIIQVLREKNPSVVVLIAKLITGWKKINLKIDGICAETTTTQSPVVSVDLSTGFINDPRLAGTMTYDYVHPNKAGQLFMTQRWYDAIITNLHDTLPPTLKGKPFIIEASSNQLSWPVAIDNYGVKHYEVYVDGNLVDRPGRFSTTYKLANVKKGHTYQVSVKAKDWSGNSSDAIVARVTLRN